MTDPSTVAAYSAGSVAAALVGVFAGLNGEAAVGALVYLTTTDEMPVWHRCVLFLASLVMGYQFAPAVAGLKVWGITPFAFPGPAAFGASLLLVTVSLAALKLKRWPKSKDSQGGSPE